MDLLIVGLLGMAERVSSMDGRLEAHPLALGGFVVRAVLPVHHRQTSTSDRGMQR